MNKLHAPALLVAHLIYLSFPNIVLAQNKLKNPTPGGGATLQEFVLLLLDIMLLVATPALVICLIYGGYLLVTANGSEDQVSSAKQWILWSFVGAAIVLGAKVIAGVIFGTASLF